MTTDSPNSTSPASPEDIWAGKSRNAKAQARHRAKRKAYIEQLEQTVSKLQTALALSPEDVTGLPTAQMKLRELKEENDSLRAEIQKLRALVYHPYAMPSSLGSHNLTSSDEYPRHAKRRRTTTHELPPRSLYLESSDALVDQLPVPQIAPRLIPPMSTSAATPLVSLGSPISPIDGHSLRDGGMSWTPYSQQQPPSHSPVPPMWTLPMHQRSRSTSSSGSSSEASPVLMTQNPSQIQTLFPSYKSTSSNMLDIPSYLRASKTVDKHSANILFGDSDVTLQPGGVVTKGHEPESAIHSGESNQGGLWTEMPAEWTYNSIRLQ